MDPSLDGGSRGGANAPVSREQALEDLRASILRQPKPAQQEVQARPAMQQQARYASPVQAVRVADAVQPVARPVQQTPQVQPMQSAQPVQQAQPYLVTNARADAEIFRADSPINQRPAVNVMAVPVVEDEESEDLRPTMTTIQYKNMTEGEKEIVRAKASEQRNKHVLDKRDKAIIATFVSVVAALFVLVIVNSVVIAGLNAELGILQSNLAVAQEALETVSDRIQSLTSLENIALYAQTHGLVLM